MTTELYIPTKETAENFEWPLSFRNCGADSDFSKYPIKHVSEQDTRQALSAAAKKLQGSFLVSATEAVHTLLAIQAARHDDS